MKLRQGGGPMREYVLAILVTGALSVAPAYAQDEQTYSEAGETSSDEALVSDPWEPMNRRLFAVHEVLDQAVAEPVARGYRAVTPSWARQGVTNALRNLRAPVIFANDVLQGEFSRAGATAARFGLNTTFGVAGLVDVADDLGIERHDEDFGQTLDRWGVPAGPYLFVPLLGPTTIRDGFGRGIDSALDPLSYAEGEDIEDFRLARGVLTALSVREALLDPVDAVRESSVDPYVTIRTQYGFSRRDAARNGRSNDEDLPQFQDIPDALRSLPPELPATAPEETP